MDKDTNSPQIITIIIPIAALYLLIIFFVSVFAQDQFVTPQEGSEMQSGKPVDFYREKIIMWVYPDMVEVEGIYYFRNKRDKAMKFPIIYPFPLDEYHHRPDSVSVVFSCGLTESGINYKLNTSGSFASYALELLPGENNVMTVFYRQKLKGNLARYILTTTSAWGKPFELAEYEVYTSIELPGAEINYPCDSDTTKGKMRKCVFSRKDFYPDRDIIVNWDGDKDLE
ncbi:MAG: hypothetical protein GF315_03030 [candidate division Zixibacteria bacterium]|nr:hypothetical protein [candidate division Zixibacteria bacterium]